MRLTLLSLLLPLGHAAAQDVVDFPMDPRTQPPLVAGTAEFQPDAADLASLTNSNQLVMRGVPLPGQGTVTLGLERIAVDYSTWGMQVDGIPTAYDPLDQTLWKGTVAGDLFSDVHLVLASHGCYGWIRTAGETWHLIPFVEAGQDWSASSVRIVPDSVMRAVAAPRGQFCLADTTRQIGTSAPPTQGLSVGQTLELKQAVETDFQFYQQWGNLNAAQNYLTALLAAISDRYTTEIDVVITFPYVQLYTNSNDPWTSQSGGPGATLTEFRNAWAGNIPNGAHLAHFISGVNGGGVAYLDVLCNQNFGFGVSFGVDGGLSFPVQQGGNTWDFVVVAHETGHNVGTPHTHDFCPPVDQCAPSGYFGQCQNTQSCTSQGTVMSYCHLCSGGMNNITTYFHPTVKTLMRTEAENSCIPVCNGCGGGSGCTDDSMEPNDNCGQAGVLNNGTSHTGLVIDGNNADWWQIDVAPGETATIDALFSHSGGDIDLRAYENCISSAGTSLSSNDNEQIVFTNGGAGTTTLFVEVFLAGASGCNDYDLSASIAVDTCSQPDDGYEENDSCAASVDIQDGFFNGFWVSKTDRDYYTLCVPAGGTVAIDLFFSTATADIDCYLYDSAGCDGIPLAQGFSSTDNESMQWTNTGSSATECILKVEVWASSPGDCNNYDMIMTGGSGNCSGGGTGPIGTTYCDPATPNSSGLPAVITATGSTTVSANNVTLEANLLPANQFGMFVVSATQASIPVAAGVLCVGGQIGRFSGPGQIQNSGAAGAFDLAIDLVGSWPVTGVTHVTPGETWHFTTWFRDLGPTSNFSDGLSITFQ